MKEEIKKQLQEQGYLTVSELESKLGIKNSSTFEEYFTHKTTPISPSLVRTIYSDMHITISELESKLGLKNSSTFDEYFTNKTTPISPSLDKTIYSDTHITVSELASELGLKNSSTFEDYLNQSRGISLEEISSENDRYLINSKKVKK
jgi:hypothetical protein